jgi:hypothetical protein
MTTPGYREDSKGVVKIKRLQLKPGQYGLFLNIIDNN